MTPAEELRAAATLLRCTHRYPVQVLTDAEVEQLNATGIPLADCLNCGSREDGRLVAKPLREPLAVLLDTLADVMEWLGPPEVMPGGHLIDGMGVPRIEWDRALTCARAITGRRS